MLLVIVGLWEKCWTCMLRHALIKNIFASNEMIKIALNNRGPKGKRREGGTFGTASIAGTFAARLRATAATGGEVRKTR